MALPAFRKLLGSDIPRWGVELYEQIGELVRALGDELRSLEKGRKLLLWYGAGSFSTGSGTFYLFMGAPFSGTPSVESQSQVPIPFNAKILSMRVHADTAHTAGTIDFRVRVNGKNTGIKLNLPADVTRAVSKGGPAGVKVDDLVSVQIELNSTTGAGSTWVVMLELEAT